MAANKHGEKILGKIQDEVFNEGLSAFRAWRQKSQNGILPVGIGDVGKTTLLSKFDVSGPELFLDFNRTLATKVDNMRLRREFVERCKGVEYFKKIDVPGELPEEWAKAYFDNNPRVLVIMVDHREPKHHIDSIRCFLSLIGEGPSFWQSAKALFCFRSNNLARVIFVVNKTDKIDSNAIGKTSDSYKALLADVHSLFNVNIQKFSLSLTDEKQSLDAFFQACLDSLSRK